MSVIERAPVARTRVLVAERYPVAGLGIRCLLEDSGFEVVAVVGTGRAALRAVSELRPDVAVIDQFLPGLNGPEIASVLRQEFETAAIIYAQDDSEQGVCGALQAGARSYVLKTDSSSQLVEAVSAASLGRSYFSPAISSKLLELLLAAEHCRQPLTFQERQVTQLISEGNLNRQIALMLDVSIKTIEAHRSSALSKLNLHRTADLVRYAIRNRMAIA